MMIQNFLDFYIIVTSIIFFFCLFQGYITREAIQKMNNSRYGYLIIAILTIWLIIGVFYFSFGEVYADEDPDKTNGTSTANVIIKDNQNTLSIKDSVINIPDSVAKGLTNVGTGAAIAAGMKAGSTIAKTAGGSPFAKLGMVFAGGVIGGGTVVTANVISSLTDKKYVTTSTPKSNSGDGGSSAFSIEPSADIDTVMLLLNLNFIFQCTILYLLWAMLILYIADKVVEKKWNLTIIKNIFGERVHSLVIKWFSYASKSNKIWLLFGFFLLIVASINSLYISHFLLNNIELISNIVQQSK